MCDAGQTHETSDVQRVFARGDTLKKRKLGKEDRKEGGGIQVADGRPRFEQVKANVHVVMRGFRKRANGIRQLRQ